MSAQQHTTELSLLQFQGRQIRVIRDAQGLPWWVAKDVCDILGYSNHNETLNRLDMDEKGVSIVDTPGGPQQVVIVNESGLYTLVLESRKRDAKVFKRWITHEVLPTLHRTGVYSVHTQAVPAPALKALRHRERSEISEQLAALWVTFKRQDLTPWLDCREITVTSGVAYNTTRQLTKYLFDLGLLNMEESFPRHLYQLSPQAAKRNPAMYQRLDLHVEILKARARSDATRWKYDTLYEQ